MMNSLLLRSLALSALAVTVATGLTTALTAELAAAQSSPPVLASQVQLRFDTTEAAVALGIVEWHKDKNALTDDDWRKLFKSDGYQRLRQREIEAEHAFPDSVFQAFLLSDSLGKRAVALRTTLEKYKRADIRGAGAKALAYLPENARVAASVYLVLKPAPSSFVYDLQRDPSIVMYLDTKQTAAQFENTIAHELHHIGFSTIGTRADSMVGSLSINARIAADWTRAFGEGFAMLAAAGGPNVHPHAVSSAADRARWDRDLTHFNRDLKRIEEFFLGVIDGKLASPDAIGGAANEFYGVEGPWYTVGWKMATTIEKKFGRKEVIECMIDPHRLLEQYNAAAAAYNKANPAAALALWSPVLVKALKRPGT